MTTSSTTTCIGTRKDGQPCRATALASGHCFAHDPQLAATRRAASAQGGRNKSRTARLRRLAPPDLVSLFEKLMTAIDEVHDGRLDPHRATGMAALAGKAIQALQFGEIEARLRALEQKNGGQP